MPDVSDTKTVRSVIKEDATLDPGAPLGAAVESARLRSLYEIGLELLSGDDPSQVTTVIRDAIAKHLNPARACVLAVKPGGAYEPVVVHNMKLDESPGSWPISHTVLQKVRDTGMAVLVSDVQTDPRLREASSVEAFRIRSILCVPLGSPVRGLVYADRRGGRNAFTKADLGFMTAIAVYATLALDRTEKHQRTRRALETSDERVAVMQEELLRHNIVGRSQSLLLAYDALRRYAAKGARVHLLGETGTGKKLFARAYAAEGARPRGPYVPVPIPSLAPTLIESELFGHVRGAFSEARADKKGRLELGDGGVVFLDEIGDVSPELQVKLLRFLDSGEIARAGDPVLRRVDALIVSATNRDLRKDAAGGRFRHDLLARLGHVVEIPPLRDRKDDIPVLAQHFLGVFSSASQPRRLSAEALAALERHDWPLNVRELQQVIERAVCLSDGEEIGLAALPAYFLGEVREAAAPASEDWSLGGARDRAERAHILRALDSTGGHRRKAAEKLGISPDTFYRRLKDLGLAEV